MTVVLHVFFHTLIGLKVDFILHLPDGKVKVFWGIFLSKINHAFDKFFRMVKISFELVHVFKLILFAP